MPFEMPTTPGFVSARFGLRTNTQIFASQLDKTVQTLELAGAQWFATYELPPMKRDRAAPWQAFLVQLMGPAGRFHAYDPDGTAPRGIYDSGADTPLVNGAGQTGSTLATDGWRPNQTGLLLPGDYFELTIGGVKYLHMVTQSVDSNGTGAATIAFGPPLRKSPGNDDALVLGAPKATMRLVDDEQASWDGDLNAVVNGFSFSAVEALA